MKKYDLLKVIFEAKDGLKPQDLSKKLVTAISNIYVYLKELSDEGFIQKTPDGLYAVNQINFKLKLILDLRAMVPGKFHKFITPAFKTVLSKLCGETKIERNVFSSAEIRTIEHLAVPSRIVLKISKRPAVYILKINESLVNTLLAYHGLNANFNLIDFEKIIATTNVKNISLTATPAESEPEVIQMCNQVYSANEDIILLKQSENFVLDQRLTDLLKNVDQTNKEYKLFINALDPKIRKELNTQWGMKYIYNTNSIEGNTMSEKDVGEYLKSGKSNNVSKRELYETNNIRHALEFLKLKKNEDISEELIKEMHYLVHKDIGGTPGEYKQFYNYVKPDSPTTPPQHVKERMRILFNWYAENKQKLHPFVLAGFMHMQFEIIHPFGDGNGRVGRLLMNHILQENNFLPITILEKTKQVYYNALRNRNINQFLLYALTSFIEEYRR